jgi:hypothetical protein
MRIQSGLDLLRVLVALGLIDLRDNRAALAARLFHRVEAYSALLGERIGRASYFVVLHLAALGLV